MLVTYNIGSSVGNIVGKGTFDFDLLTPLPGHATERTEPPSPSLPRAPGPYLFKAEEAPAYLSGLRAVL